MCYWCFTSESKLFLKFKVTGLFLIPDWHFSTRMLKTVELHMAKHPWSKFLCVVKSAILPGPNVEFTVLCHKLPSVKHRLRRFTHMVITLLRKNISSTNLLSQELLLQLWVSLQETWTPRTIQNHIHLILNLFRFLLTVWLWISLYLR